MLLVFRSKRKLISTRMNCLKFPSVSFHISIFLLIITSSLIFPSLLYDQSYQYPRWFVHLPRSIYTISKLVLVSSLSLSTSRCIYFSFKIEISWKFYKPTFATREFTYYAHMSNRQKLIVNWQQVVKKCYQHILPVLSTFW